MSGPALQAALHRARAEGLLPATADHPGTELRPWPIVLLTGLGAWLAAVPLGALVALLVLSAGVRGAGAYLIAALILGAAILVLRRRDLPLFLEQLAFPALLVGAGALAVGLAGDTSASVACGTLALVLLGAGFAIPRAWLRVLLGAAAVVLASLAWMLFDGKPSEAAETRGLWLCTHAGLAAWLLGGVLQRALLPRWPRAAAALESMRAGWLLAVVAGLAAWAGMTFMVGASIDAGSVGAGADRMPSAIEADGFGIALRATSLLLALLAAGWAARRWPTLRASGYAGVAAVLAALAAFMPSLGAVLLVLAVCATSARWRLAAAAGVAAAWIVGAFYYQLAWPLSTKALVLIGAGGLLGALAWLVLHRRAPAGAVAGARSVPTAVTGGTMAEAPMPAESPRPAGAGSPRLDTPVPGWLRDPRLGIGATALAVLVVANAAIWQKEALIAGGEPVFVELAPADPRSLMQGDFMALDFRLPDIGDDADGLLAKQRPYVVGRRDARGVAEWLRVDAGQALGPGEFRVELTPKNGRWTLVTDAWYFSEGEAPRWQRARYGEFRVDAEGRALLVGMRGAGLERL